MLLMHQIYSIAQKSRVDDKAVKIRELGAEIINRETSVRRCLEASLFILIAFYIEHVEWLT